MTIYRIRHTQTGKYWSSHHTWNDKGRIFKTKTALSNFLSGFWRGRTDNELLEIVESELTDLHTQDILDYVTALELRVRKKHGQHGNHYTVRWQ